MKRNLTRLSQHVYDALIIGGGIYGLWVAWDAALRGLCVALLEKGDFGHATSSNSLRIIHGGLRYLQHGDVRRVRQSIYERKVLMRVAPHLVHPLPFIIPTYGHGMRGNRVLSLGLALNDLIGFDRNYRQDPQKYMPRGRIISKGECLHLLHGVERDGLTGGALFYDAQVADAERLILAIARSAAQAGADVANHVEVTRLLAATGRVVGVSARDVLTGDTLEVRADTVVNATGPWMDRVLRCTDNRGDKRPLLLSKTFNLLVNRQLFPRFAVGVYSTRRSHDRDAILGKDSRVLFITPWRDRSLIGTAHLPYDADPDHFTVTEAEVQAFLDEINAAYPAAELQRQDVCFASGGLLPVTSYGAGDVQPGKRSQVLDHGAEGGPKGLISVIGVKFTDARAVAERAVDLVYRKLGRTPVKSATAVTPVNGGGIGRVSAFLDQQLRKGSQRISAEAVADLIWRYGAAYPGVLRYLEAEPASPAAITAASGAPTSRLQPLDSLLEAEILYGVREEMAHKLADVVFRRTTVGSAGDPGDVCLRACAAVMAKELGWDARRTQAEVDEVKTALSTRSATV